MKRRKVQRERFTYLIASGSMLALVGVLADLRGVFSPEPRTDLCQEILQPRSVLSRDELSRLLTVPERSTKARVREVVQEPYCTLPEVEVRAGAIAIREAYPLAFDPQTWFVILYEEGEYAGYAFSFQH